MTKITKDLNDLAFALLDRDASNLSAEDDYTEEDVMNAVIVFNSITANYGIKHGFLADLKLSKEAGLELAAHVLKRTGVDPRKYYNA